MVHAGDQESPGMNLVLEHFSQPQKSTARGVRLL